MSVETINKQKMIKEAQDAESWADSIMGDIDKATIWVEDDTEMTAVEIIEDVEIQEEDSLIAKRGDIGSFIGMITGKDIQLETEDK
jgi:hypothetical protein